MTTVLRLAGVLVMVLALITGGTAPVLACGPFTLDPVFGFTKHGEYPLSEYAGGKIGIVPTTYGRISLFVYYRYLNGIPLSVNERDEVSRAIARRINTEGWSPGGDTPGEGREAEAALARWAKARASVLPGSINIELEKSLDDRYNFFPNCLGDAFETAAATLELRIGANRDRAEIREWVRGQDAVFSNCGGDDRLPSGVPNSVSEWLKQDRDYQTASARFYRGEMSAARTAYERISADKSSVWAAAAGYLVARTLIREASFSAEDAAGELKKAEHLESAASRLREVIADPASTKFHGSAQGLLNLVKYRKDPGARTRELAAALANNQVNPNIFNDLTDYIWLLDKIEQVRPETRDEPEEEEDTWGYQVRLRDIPEADRTDDLTDWLFTYQAPDGFDHALRKWRQGQKAHWLVAALSKADSASQGAGELIKAAETLRPGSSPFPNAMYHAARLSAEAGRDDEARRLSDKVFAAGFDDFPTATVNSFRAQRAGLAQTLGEFLTYAKRTPTAYLWSDDGNETGSDDRELDEMSNWRNRQMFGEDAVAVLNRKAPLSVWLKASQSDEIPGYLRDFIASAGWTRAFLIGDRSHESLFAPVVRQYSKEYAPLFANYINSRSRADKEAAALILIARYPVIEPSIAARWGRKWTRPTTIDSNRGNWWCLDQEQDEASEKPAFLTADEFESGIREYAKLRALGEGSTAIASRALDFAKRNPRHRRTPEILHLGVRATRYGCKDLETGRLSKESFRLLKKRYPGSPWARRTPYWYQ